MEKLARKPGSLKDWKRFNDAYVVPDRGFVKQLKLLDKDLEVVWDCTSCNWEIWSFPPLGEPYLVMTVGTRGKDYKELSSEVLLQMQKNIFFSQNLTAKQICDYLDEADNQLKRRKEEEFRKKLMDKVLDTFDYARGVMKIQVPRALKLEGMVRNA